MDNDDTTTNPPPLASATSNHPLTSQLLTTAATKTTTKTTKTTAPPDLPPLPPNHKLPKIKPPPYRLLIGKVAAITGATTGIGRGIALAYLTHGANVAINYLPLKPTSEPTTTSSTTSSSTTPPTTTPKTTIPTPDDLNTLIHHATLITQAGGGTLLPVPGDITQPSTAQDFIGSTVSHFGKLDIFVSNAGICEFADFLTMEDRIWERTLDVNLGAAWRACREAGRQMARQVEERRRRRSSENKEEKIEGEKEEEDEEEEEEEEQEGGSMIAISSISALVGGGHQVHYTPTKAGLLSLTQSMAIALGPYKIRCNALLPGTIRTGLNEYDLKEDAKRTYMEGRIPLGRLGRPADIAGPAVWLAVGGELSGYVNGASLLVDGGMFVNLQ